jgi:hypothetical protein
MQEAVMKDSQICWDLPSIQQVMLNLVVTYLLLHPQ